MWQTGERIGVAVSGGADSVSLLRAMVEVRQELGLVISVVHVNHMLRDDADSDEAFVRALATNLDCRFHTSRCNVRARSEERDESIETAARGLRYEFFDSLLAAGEVDVIATAHTRDDQAETVMMKLLRGAGTRGMSGIHPVVRRERGKVVRPMLGTPRVEVEAYLREIGQEWRTDQSNASCDFTRNRMRHDVLPVLRTYEPHTDAALANAAEIARAEEEYWEQEVERVVPLLATSGQPVRGGGRASSGGATVALPIDGLRRYSQAMQRRIARGVLRQLGLSATLAETDAVLGAAGLLSGDEDAQGERKWRPLREGVCYRRLHREIQIGRIMEASAALPATEVAFDGSNVEVKAGTVRLRISIAAPNASATAQATMQLPAKLTLRGWRAGDRIELPHSGGAHKVKELLQRKRLAPEERAGWPVVEWNGTLLWLRGYAQRAIEVIATDRTVLGALLIEEV